MTLSRQLGIENSVSFPGLVQDVPALLSSHNLYVQASHQEGLPNAVLEAMANGLPTVATQISGHEDVIAHGVTGLLVPPNHADELAAALSHLAENPNLRQEMGATARRFVEQYFSTEAVMQSLLAVYTQPSAPLSHPMTKAKINANR
jgi:glycosyltransferase involved in cell wall biosynthesis